MRWEREIWDGMAGPTADEIAKEAFVTDPAQNVACPGRTSIISLRTLRLNWIHLRRGELFYWQNGNASLRLIATAPCHKLPARLLIVPVR